MPDTSTQTDDEVSIAEELGDTLTFERSMVRASIFGLKHLDELITADNTLNKTLKQYIIKTLKTIYLSILNQTQTEISPLEFVEAHLEIYKQDYKNNEVMYMYNTIDTYYDIGDIKTLEEKIAEINNIKLCKGIYDFLSHLRAIKIILNSYHKYIKK